MVVETEIGHSQAVAVNSAAHRQLYAKRAPVHPKLVSGQFRLIKTAILILTLGVYYLTPFLRWNHGPGEPDQAVLVDFPGRKIYLFFIELWPQDVAYVSGLLILGALALFLSNALFGRVWCGFTCPQTVWTDLYITVERLIEGDRNARLRLDKAPWSADKITKKVIKHAIWLLIAAATGGALVMYFHDVRTLFPEVFLGTAPMGAYMFGALLTFTTYALAGTMREQVCTYMCPWPRIQAAMTDSEALQVTYKRDRGEPRGPHKRGQTWDNRGDCVDCTACVAACPMGIDIREGSQIECINCGLCVDACDEIMVKVERPKGLIAFDTDDNADRRQAGLAPRWRPIRARTLIYVAVMAVIAGLMGWSLLTRSSIDLNVLRDRNPTFVRLSDGSVRNAYTIRVLNKTNAARGFELRSEGLPLALDVVGGAVEPSGAIRFELEADGVRTLRVLARHAADGLPAGRAPVTFVVEAEDGAELAVKSIFVASEQRGP